MSRPARIGAFLLPIIMLFAPAAAASHGGRLPFELVVVNSHTWGKGTEAWIADMDGDGLDELVGANEELAQVCPIRFVGETYLEAGQINLPIADESLHEIAYLGPRDIDDDGADEFLLSAVRRDTLWLLCYGLGDGLEDRVAVATGESISREPWWDGKVRDLCRIDLGERGHGYAVAMGADMDLLPRGIVMYDAEFESVLWSYEGGAQFRRVCGGDVDGDGREEVVFGSSSVSNGAEMNGTTDRLSYAGVIDDDGRLMWIHPGGGPSTDTHAITVDLTGDGRAEVVWATTPELESDDPVSTIAVRIGATGVPLGEVSVPGRVGRIFSGRTRHGEARAFFGNRGRRLFSVGIVEGETVVTETARLPGRGVGWGCVPVEGVSGDCVLAGLRDGRLLVYDAGLRLLAQHWPRREPLFLEPPFLGLYREKEDEVLLCGISDSAYFFDLVRSPLDWGLVWLIVAVAGGSALATAVSVSPALRGRASRAIARGLAPLMPWAEAERARARSDLLAELETGSHDRMIVTRPLRHLVELLTMARGAGKRGEELVSVVRKWARAYRETSRPALDHVLDLARAWGGAHEEESCLRTAVASAGEGLSRLEVALATDEPPRDIAPELSSLAMRVDALEAALQEMRAKAGEAYVTEVAPALADVLDMHASDLASTGVGLATSVAAAGDASVWIAPEDFRFVVSNLVTNALRAMSDAAVRRLTVETSTSGGFLELRFVDTGSGIPEEKWDRIFELGETTKEGPGGTGLYRSREVVTRLRGSLRIERSAVGEGTAMLLRLRLAAR
ncbi:MAG: hypothetical protein GF400_02855 [Candidatus Eisenbacteria bacterium]|nr:hypothetical protein [Candidatus Eisenbacteria bacterium]